jgi:SAM-dependent methyltransferase
MTNGGLSIDDTGIGEKFSQDKITNPYDELPYRSLPIEWTAPERLALASLLHGGPRPPLKTYRVLEIGCGDGANLLALGYFRKHAMFVGVDGARSRIEIAEAHRSQLGLSNVSFIHTDFHAADRRLSGCFDYIVAHGIFSWISADTRDILLELCAKRLHRRGLLYLNYNARPGWNVRGMIREFLLAQTAGLPNLRARAQLAQDVAAQIIASMEADEHPYSRLLVDEFRFVCESHISLVAHEYLAVHNYAYWRSEFLAHARQYRLEYLADADFCYRSGRLPEDLAPQLSANQITGRTLDDTVDLLCYRQLHSPILTPGPFEAQMPSPEEIGDLLVASCLVPCASESSDSPMFIHPSGYRVEAKQRVMGAALERLQPLWPRGLTVKAVFADVGSVMGDLKLLQRNGLIELRCIEPGDFGVGSDPLNRLENQYGGYVTTPYHTINVIST